MPALTANDVIGAVKSAALALLRTKLPWANQASLMEVTEFGLPPLSAEVVSQFLFSASVTGQSGGSFITTVNLEVAVVIRRSQDNIGRIDALMRQARDRLAAVQRVLEGQGLNLLAIPLFTDVGPTMPEVFEGEPPFGLCYLSMSGKHYQSLFDALEVDPNAFADTPPS